MNLTRLAIAMTTAAAGAFVADAGTPPAAAASHVTTNAPIVGAAADPATGGYWEVASDGGIFTTTAPFHGSMGGHPLNQPVVGMAATKTGGGYWEVASDGGIFTFGNAQFHGSMGGHPLNRPVVGMAADPATGGYWEVASDGGIFTFAAPFFGAGTGGPSPFGSVAPVGDGYVLCDRTGDCAVAGPGQLITGRSLWPGASGPPPSTDATPPNPSANVAPDPNFILRTSVYRTTPLPACWAWGPTTLITDPTTASCVNAAVGALDNARRAEGLAPMGLPNNFAALTPEEQLFVLFDLERVARGMSPIAGLAATLDAIAQGGAAHNADPGFPTSAPGFAGGGSVWAGAINPLTATYQWMYDDGWGGPTATFNGDCTSPTAPGCWGHRDAILEPGADLAMGAGYVANGWVAGEFSSYAGLIVSYASSSDLPPLYYTWAAALAAGASA